MNFPNATAAEWQHAANVIASGARRAGYCAADADDMSQNAMMAILRRNYRRGMPNGPVHAARILRRQAQRLGWAMLSPAADNARRRSEARRQKCEEHMLGVATARSVTPSPADMAAQAEHHGIPVYRVHEANGIGIGALAEPGQTPSVYGSGPGLLPPVAGCRGLHVLVDPNAERTLEQRQPPQYLTGDALSDYRQRLAEARGED